MSINNINSIYPLSANGVSKLTTDLSKLYMLEDGNETANNFASILTDSMKTAAEADTADKVSGLQLLAGQSDDLSGLLIDAQKAELSLNLALQIRNKVIDAYNEIMRMQV
ncbi:MAG: flagellar hook-basal body complex protein FliE [Oscillospiraceae bacterium]|nr:flagellar hook-basal body complex protein FliE [Oscillospiraceae bacterium]